MRCHSWVLAVSLALIAGRTSKSQTQTAAGSVVGNVVCDDGDVPARGAHVALIPLSELMPKQEGAKPDSAANAETTTDFSGGYELPAVAPGTYLVTANTDGYSDEFALTRKLLPRFTPDEQKRLLALFPQVTVHASSGVRQDLVLHRAGAVSGQVTVDVGGTVHPGSPVTATMVAGKLIGIAADPQHPVEFTKGALTDDRGVYRIAGLPPGTYTVSLRVSETYFNVKVVNSAVFMSAARAGISGLVIWAPEALKEKDAHLVRVTEGAETQGVDLAVPTRKVHSISGFVTQGGAPLAGASVKVMSGGQDLGLSDALTLSDGSYRFDLLPQGSYTVQVTRYSQPATGGLSVIGGAKSPRKGEVKSLQKSEAHVLLAETDLENINIDLPAVAAGKD